MHLPPLRDRSEDIPLLTRFFLSEQGIPVDGNGNGHAATLDRLGLILSARLWPGNVRELRATIRRLALTSGADLGRMVELALCDDSTSEESQLAAALQATGGNKSRAAEILGVSEGAIRKRIRKYGLSE